MVATLLVDIYFFSVEAFLPKVHSQVLRSGVTSQKSTKVVGQFIFSLYFALVFTI